MRNKPFYHCEEEVDIVSVYVPLTITSVGQQMKVCVAIPLPLRETDDFNPDVTSGYQVIAAQSYQ